MLGMHEQHGGTCLAYALWNAGIVTEKDVQAYEQMAKGLDGDPMAQLMAYSGFLEFQVGSWAFAKEWLKHSVPDSVYNSLKATYDRLAIHPLKALNYQDPDFSGHGVVVVWVGIGMHIMAFDNGLIFDSDPASPDNPGKPETMDNWLRRTNAQIEKIEAEENTHFPRAKVIDVLPIKEPAYA